MHIYKCTNERTRNARQKTYFIRDTQQHVTNDNTNLTIEIWK